MSEHGSDRREGEGRTGRERTLVVLPTYDEAENLPGILPRILAADSRIDVLVVDDASPDGTGRIADQLATESPRVHVLHRAGKQGLGSAYLAGFAWGLERGYAFLCEMDADFSHDPRYLPELLRAAREEADLVIGSRYVRGVNVINWPMGRLLLSWFANRYARWITGMPLSDATSGFKCFRREVLEAIPLERVGSTGYAFQIEMDFRAWKKGFRLHEVPIVFSDRTDGQSKMSGAIVREAVWRVWALRLASIFGRL
ncbi:MAG: polyprenol monophosphomannose synthase [Gemmatimonadota bacterium]|nr:polyprenol monophosphomannose synthase [Gemmatimonadota bacterium]